MLRFIIKIIFYIFIFFYIWGCSNKTEVYKKPLTSQKYIILYGEKLKIPVFLQKNGLYPKVIVKNLNKDKPLQIVKEENGIYFFNINYAPFYRIIFKSATDSDNIKNIIICNTAQYTPVKSIKDVFFNNNLDLTILFSNAFSKIIPSFKQRFIPAVYAVGINNSRIMKSVIPSNKNTFVKNGYICQTIVPKFKKSKIRIINLAVVAIYGNPAENNSHIYLSEPHKILIQFNHTIYEKEIILYNLSMRKDKVKNELLLEKVIQHFCKLKKSIPSYLIKNRKNFLLPKKSILYLPNDADICYAVNNLKNIFENNIYLTKKGKYKTLSNKRIKKPLINNKIKIQKKVTVKNIQKNDQFSKGKVINLDF